MIPVNVPDKCRQIEAPWSPKIIAELNGQEVKIARLEGEFVWHSHDVDELFYVLEGRFVLMLREGVIPLKEGDVYVVRAGVEHKPVAAEPCTVMLFEPEGVVNTGDAGGDLTNEAERN
jgi:mannose-6-phosphate isomerase-like protein (cupin superfamily)